MSSSGGITRFLLFVALIGLGATSYYAYGQHSTLESYRKANATLTDERNALVAKNGELVSAAQSAEVKIQESAATVAQLQQELEAAKKPRARKGR